MKMFISILKDTTVLNKRFSLIKSFCASYLLHKLDLSNNLDFLLCSDMMSYWDDKYNLIQDLDALNNIKIKDEENI